MTADTLIDAIKNPARLYQLPFQELKSLSLQYPYCRNLQYLLLYKCLREGRDETAAILARTAMNSIDRTLLWREFRRLHIPEAPQVEAFELEDEYLVLKDLSAAAQEREPLETIPSFDVAPLSSSSRPTPSFKDLEDDEAEESDNGSSILLYSAPPKNEPPPAASPEMPPAEETPASEPLETTSPAEAFVEAAFLAFSDFIDSQLTTQPARRQKTPPHVEQESGVTPPPNHAPAWRRSAPPVEIPPLDMPIQPLHEPPPESPPPQAYKTPKKEDEVIAFAERSIQLREQVASETLAHLLERQERHDKAIEVYERLILLNPEKSAFFAKKIEELKKLL